MGAICARHTSLRCMPCRPCRPWCWWCEP
jgi:hypothetical protein